MEGEPVHTGCGRIMKVRLGAIAVLAAGLVACGPDEDDILFDGQFFRASIDSERATREKFTVKVRPASSSLLGAREAARYEATVYCIGRYGSSKIKWIGASPDSEDTELTIRDDTLFMQGECPT